MTAQDQDFQLLKDNQVKTLQANAVEPTPAFKSFGYFELDDNLPTLREMLNRALQETMQMMQIGFDISDPSVVTPLGWIANKYPEIAEDCNHALSQLMDEQIEKYPNYLLYQSDGKEVDEF